MSAAGDELDGLLRLMQRLRDPQRGCPWDRVQDFASIAPYTIEEAYEVADAVTRNDMDALREELGDLLFQVVFHACMAEEAGRFDFAAVARGIRAKLERRHPHVFGDVRIETQSELNAAWEAAKAEERAAEGARGALANVPLGLPALTRAAKLGGRAARVGFDWADAAGVRAKIDEELAEIDAALANADPRALSEELGDLLFTMANWSRHLHVDAENALRLGAAKFERRFEHMEHLSAARGLSLTQLSAQQWDELWCAAKAQMPG